jgi:hypothetical protein
MDQTLEGTAGASDESDRGCIRRDYGKGRVDSGTARFVQVIKLVACGTDPEGVRSSLLPIETVFKYLGLMPELY